MKSIAQILLGILVFAFLPAGSGFCEDFEISVTSFPDTIVLGMLVEFHINVQNTTGKELTVPWWRWYPVQVQILDEFGNPPEFFGGEIEELSVPIMEPPDWKGKRIESGWTETTFKQFGFAKPGNYKVRLLMDFHGPYVNRNGVSYEAWEGAVEKILSISVKQPEGVDREVFEALNIDSLEFFAGPKGLSLILREYPTSTYASYLIWVRLFCSSGG